MKRSGFFIMSKKLFIKGTLLLTFAGLLSRLMGFFYRIFLSHTIGAHGLGIFQLILPLQILIMSICASGIQTAISRLTAAEKVSENPSRHISDYFVVGTVFSVVFSLVFSWFLYSYADFWAVQILKEPQTSGLIRILSLSIPLSTLHTCINSYYLGRKQAGFPAGVQLLEQLYKGGKDIARVMDELAGVFRDLMICKSAPAEKGLLSAMPHDHPEIERLAGLFSLDEILRCLTLIQECTDNIARSRSRRTLAEMCFVKLCTGAPTAAQAAAAKTVGAVSQSGNAQNFAKTAASKPMGSEFAPLPDDKLDPSRAATVNKLREIFNRNEAPAEKPEPVREAKPAAPEKPAISPAPAKQEKTPPADLPFDIGEPKKTDVPDAAKPAAPAVPDAPASAMPAAPDIPPLPEMNSRPAAPEAEYILPEEPPVEYTPPREFATAPEPQTAPAQPAGPAKPVKPSVKAETPAKSGEIKTESKKSSEPEASPAPDTGYTKLVSLTQEEWSQIIEKVPSPLYGAMLDGSTATVNEDGVLEIHTGNLMLQGIVSDGCQELEKELAGAFGKKIRARVVGEEQENTDEEKDLPVKQLLDKARQLNIEVDIK